MDSSRKSEVTAGVVLPLVALVVVFALGVVTGNGPVYVAMMAAVPMLAAVFAPVSLTVAVAVVTFLSALVLTLLPEQREINDSVPSLIALVVFAVIAVIASRFRTAGRTAASAAAVAPRKRMQFQLQTQADTDSMTGLLNRRGAIRVLGPRNADKERVVAFLDCDLFKQVNDEFGSDVGDEFLQAIAGRLRHSLPALDTVARWDGDEFLLVVAADEGTAYSAVTRVVATINGHPIRTTAGPILATVSVGAAVWAPGQELEDVIARAGRALYGAKNAGRGQVVVDGAAPVSSAGSGAESLDET